MEFLKNVTHHENSESPLFQEKIILRYSCKHFQHKHIFQICSLCSFMLVTWHKNIPEILASKKNLIKV